MLTYRNPDRGTALLAATEFLYHATPSEIPEPSRARPERTRQEPPTGTLIVAFRSIFLDFFLLGFRSDCGMFVGYIWTGILDYWAWDWTTLDKWTGQVDWTGIPEPPCRLEHQIPLESRN